MVLLTSQSDQSLISLRVSGLPCILSLVYRKKKSRAPSRKVVYSGFNKNHVYYNRVRANTQREK